MLISLLILMVIDITNYCSLCHSDIQALYVNSVHWKEQIKCIDCHGGDALSDDITKAHQKDFKGKIDKAKSLKICSDCHSDLNKMKPFGLSADQYALYLTSYHGLAFLRGDNKAAVCTDCHNSHNILRSKDPRSPVFKLNIAKTCSKCHDDEKLMKIYNLPYQIGKEYEQSIHYEELNKQGNLRAPTCIDCHGTHGASPPGIADVAKVCGNCHISAREYFMSSPHKKAMDSKLMPECASCHENHKVKKANISYFKWICNNCHSKNSHQVKMGEKIYTLFNRTKEQLELAKKAVAEAESIPINVEDYESRIEEAYTYYMRALSITHSLKIQEYEDLLIKAKSIAEEIQSDILGKKSELNDRKIILIAFWFYVLITIAIIHQYKKSIFINNGKA